MTDAPDRAAHPAPQRTPSTGAPTPPRDAREMLELARGFLARKGLGEARLEAELLVGHALGLNRLGLYMRLDQPVTPAEVDAARDLLVRRGRREPTAYIVGRREFFGRDFGVGPGVLVPRPETELLVDRARELEAELRATAGERPLRVLDIGTGSGCLAITLALELDAVEVHAIDLSPEALQRAQGNAEALSAEVTFHQGDGFEVAGRLVRANGPFDLVVSNPPYVEPRERGDLAPEVLLHEPEMALFAPEDDLDLWAVGLARRAPDLLVPGGALLVELGHTQAPRLRATLGPETVIRDDLAGIPRMLEVRRAR